ncbi:Iron permease FTR1 [Ophiocordyceps camponoti-floridani]|uniref:Iron permease FTR1 n=1 Tax=Ophiocordyceps camponoti-floridani TaxID=2030778 RepID=A0A8H4VC18_9HYPO|nr:Iron permease FTR1 [Ophiocordyceps camponoti-floridani]
MGSPYFFSVPVFLIVFRETLEAVIIVSILLAFLSQTLDKNAQAYRVLRRQVWIGVASGFVLCMIIAGAVIGVWYTLSKNSWEANENYYEGAFCIVASVIITIMGAALLRIGNMRDKWRVKVARALDAPVKTGSRRWWAQLPEKYAMFYLPFITVLREGVEAVVFIAGVSFPEPATAVPLPVIVGLGLGIFIGWLLYKGASTAKLQLFLVLSTCLLYLVAAGLFSRGVWHFETQEWNIAVGGDAAETGDGPGSYDIDRSVWHVNCCSPVGPNSRGWGIFNAILGWQNSATYGSVISYNMYWIAVVTAFVVMRFRENKSNWPAFGTDSPKDDSQASDNGAGVVESKHIPQEKTVAVSA